MDIQSDKPKKISVSIGGISYQLVSGETESYMKDISAKADEAIKQMLQNNPSLSNIQATVLAMVNLIDMMTKETSEIDKMRARLEELSFSEAKAKHELYLQREHGFELKKEILRVNELNRMLELEVAALRQGMSNEYEKAENENFEEDIELAHESAKLEVLEASEDKLKDESKNTFDNVDDDIYRDTKDDTRDIIDLGDPIINNEDFEEISKEIAKEMAIESIINKEVKSGDNDIAEYTANSSETSEESEESAYIDSDDLSNEDQVDEQNYVDDLSDDPDSFHHYRQQSLDDVFN